MKVTKSKRNKRILEFYKTLHSLTEPYRVLVDGSFVFAALKNKIHIKEQLPILLGGSAVPYVSNCILNELRNMGDDLSGAVLIVKHYQKIKCFHKAADNPNSRRCILAAVGNNNQEKLFVASQDKTLIKWLRESGGIPIIKLNNNVPYLEKPSFHTLDQKLNIEESKKLPKAWEKPYLSAPERPKEFKKKKKKNPNPLSCLKKKKKPEEHDKPKSKNRTRVRSRRSAGQFNSDSNRDKNLDFNVSEHVDSNPSQNVE
ncbi:hypothetical protein MACJ_001987 [Theileria orientalis]|uniref:UTP23 sensor motif region domain-containing protein n=1 Tax=Theileria orientalis TaxID=68886 RepID=A0A976QSB0_THEOR|nr:hypothetical protein MACJ_001987 [Theileria orientalis]